MNLKKVFYSLAVGAGLMLGTTSMVHAQTAAPAATDATNGFGVNQTITSEIGGVAGTGTDGDDSLISVIRRFLNWVLGLLSLIAFVMLLVGGFQMVTAGGDEAGYKKGFVYVKNAGIGLAFIALSWLIVTLIFYVLNLVSGAGGS